MITQQILLNTLEDAYQLEIEAEELTQKAAKLMEKREQIIRDHISADQLEEGPFRIHIEISGRRTVNLKRIREMFPEAYEKLKEIKETITVKNAEKYFSAEDQDKIFDTNFVEKVILQYMAGGKYI
jgi:hypothetical protein